MAGSDVKSFAKIGCRIAPTGRLGSVGLAILALIACTTLPPRFAHAEDAEISARRASQRTDFTDAEIAEGFFKLAFGAEFHVGGRVDRIRKYDKPVRIFIENRGKPNRGDDVGKAIADIKARVDNLDIAVTKNQQDANVTVTLVRDRDFDRTVRRLYGSKRARQIQHSLEPQCLSGFRKDSEFRIVRSNVILVTDVDEFTFYDCLYEELLQSLGPINDDSSVPWSMFNDDVQMGFFDIYDQFLLNILYDPRVRPGMTADEVRAILPEVLPKVRDWVASVNARTH
jgi:hypothetical protein